MLAEDSGDVLDAVWFGSNPTELKILHLMHEETLERIETVRDRVSHWKWWLGVVEENQAKFQEAAKRLKP